MKQPRWQMVMVARNTKIPTYTVLENGKRLGELVRPLDPRVFGRTRGTVYLNRLFLQKSRKAAVGGRG